MTGCLVAAVFAALIVFLYAFEPGRGRTVFTVAAVALLAVAVLLLVPADQVPAVLGSVAQLLP